MVIQEQLIGGNRLKQTNLQLNYGIISEVVWALVKTHAIISTHDEFNKEGFFLKYSSSENVHMVSSVLMSV